MVNKSLENFDKLPFTSLIDKPIPKRHISTLDLQNETIRSKFMQIDSDCYSQCKQVDCYTSLSLTSIEAEQVDGGKSAAFYLHTPRSASMTISHSAKVTFEEMVVLLFSIIGRCVIDCV